MPPIDTNGVARFRAVKGWGVKHDKVYEQPARITPKLVKVYAHTFRRDTGRALGAYSFASAQYTLLAYRKDGETAWTEVSRGG